MHRFWEIDELVRTLATDLKQRNASASAIALACCSERLGDIVLDPLWEQLDDLRRLMQCLPPDTWELREGTFFFLRCPTTDEWTRFSTYSRRVRKIDIRCFKGTGVSLEAFSLLSMQTPTLGQYPLPNLRSIHWVVAPWDTVPFLRLFLNPGLASVRIDFPDNEPHPYRPATISLIPTGGLTDLELECTESEDFPFDALYDLLDGASGTLRSISLDRELSVAVAEKILQLPNLRFLSAEMPKARISPPAVVFPSLEKLDVWYKEAGSWLHILQNIPNPALRELNVFFSGSSPIYLQTLGSSLLSANIEKTLVSLECYSKGIPLTEAGIRPLLSFGGLTELKLFHSCAAERCNVRLNDSIISELAMALPRLRSLFLGGHPCKTAASDVTVTSLVALSASCINLDFLGLHFDANDIVTRHTHASSRIHKSTCGLRTLSVGSQPLSSTNDDILLVTFTILHIFPHVENIISNSGPWKQVERGIQLFRKAPMIIPLPGES